MAIGSSGAGSGEAGGVGQDLQEAHTGSALAFCSSNCGGMCGEGDCILGSDCLLREVQGLVFLMRV
jgi:hypothetical protein